MQTFIETEKKGLIKKFHTLLGKNGIDSDAKEMLLMDNFGVSSSKDLTVPQLVAICNTLHKQANPGLIDLDKYRKHLIGSIGGWLRKMGKTENIGIIKAVACRASGRDSFNAIPLEQLRSLYNAFNKKQKDLQMVEKLTSEELDILTSMN
jgi:hypothetical protein